MKYQLHKLEYQSYDKTKDEIVIEITSLSKHKADEILEFIIEVLRDKGLITCGATTEYKTIDLVEITKNVSK